jgi:hypothetical protein
MEGLMADFGRKTASNADLEDGDHLIRNVKKLGGENKGHGKIFVILNRPASGKKFGPLSIRVEKKSPAKRKVLNGKRQRELRKIADATEGWQDILAIPSDGKGPWKTVRVGTDAPRTVTLEQQKLISLILDKLSGAKLASAIESSKTLEDVANLMVASLPETNDLDAGVGPFYDTAGLVKWLGITRQAIFQRVRSGTLLGVQSSDGHWMYPSFQFTDKGEPLPRLREVVGAINPGNTDAWGTAIWLNYPMSKLGGSTPAEALRTDLADTVVTTASRIKSGLAS